VNAVDKKKVEDVAASIEMLTDTVSTNAAVTLLIGQAAKRTVEAVDIEEQDAQREAFLKVAGQLYDIVTGAHARERNPS
jgi:hypothetical protein